VPSYRSAPRSAWLWRRVGMTNTDASGEIFRTNEWVGRPRPMIRMATIIRWWTGATA
jgi:hypothetical protein